MNVSKRKHQIRRVAFGLMLTAWVMIVSLVAVASAQADPTNGWHMTAAGDAGGLWLLSPIHGPRRDGEEAAAERGQLHYFPASAPMGTAIVLRAHTIGEPPAVMTASGGRLVFLYPGSAAHNPGSSLVEAAQDKTIPVRSVRLALVRPPVVFLDPPDRFTAQPALRTPGDLLHAVDTDAGLFALLWVEGRLSISALDHNGWREIVLPADLDPSAPARLLKRSDAVSLLSRDRAGSATLWSLDIADESWTGAPAPDDAVGRRLFAAGASIVVPEHNGSTGTLLLRSIEGEKMIPLATVEGVAVEHAVAAMGENVAIVWLDDEVSARLRIVIVSSVTGRTLYDGYTRFPPPLTPSDLRMVVLLLSAVMLGVLLFVLKPETMAESSPPAGCVLAEPGRRFGAASVDLLIAGVISSAIWGVTLPDAINPNVFLLISGNDSWPMVTTMALYFFHGLFAEWIFGRTIGKAMLGCRLRSVRGGGRLKLWQATVRNLVKGVAPPLVVLVLFDPNRRHPGDLLGGTMVIKNPSKTNGHADGNEPGADDGAEGDSDDPPSVD